MSENKMFIAYSPDEIRGFFKEVIQETFVRPNENKCTSKSLIYERMTRKEAMAFLKVGSSKFNELRRKGLIKPQRAGNRTYYSKTNLISYCENLQ